jgi:glycosyltransferase involved in cell wall biosynthesis
VAALSEGLLKRGHDVEVFTTDLKTEIPFVRDPTLPGEVNGVRVRRLRATTIGGEAHYVFAPGMRRAVFNAARDADIIHAHSYGYIQTLLAPLAARLTDVPFVLTPHFHPFWSMEGGGRRAVLRHAFDWTIGRADVKVADAVIAVTREELQLLKSQLRIARLPTSTVIPNGVDLGAFTQASGVRFRAFYGLGDEPLIVFAGRLASNKGLRVLVEAMGYVTKAVPAVRLILVGEDQGLLAEIQSLAKAGGVRLLATGHLPEDLFASAIAAANVFVLPSDYEAFGIVLLEAMACRRPIVATRVGGVPDVVTDGREGILVQPREPRALAHAIEELLLDRRLAEDMGSRGAEKVKDYDWISLIPRIESIYHEVRTRRRFGQAHSASADVISAPKSTEIQLYR